MQFWQQQLIYKQLQEQRQRQLDRGALQNNSARQMSAAMRPVAIDQSPLMMSSMPNYAWNNNFNGSLPRETDNSQILGADNMNSIQPISSTMQNVSNGYMLTNDRDQAVQPMGLIHKKLDQSSIGLPVSSHKRSMYQYSQNSGIANACNYSMTKASGSHAGKASDSYNIFQRNQHYAAQGSLQEETTIAMKNLQGKELYGHNSSQLLCSDRSSANFQQTNDFQHGFHVQGIHNRQERGDCSGKFKEKQPELVGGACGLASLDLTEEKISFGSENDDNWGASLVGNPNSYLGNNYFGGFPSIQSGSWSALMQEAVQASSSERGIQEEWSGLDSQKMEQSTVGYSGKQLDNLNDGNMQNASCLTRKPFPLFNDSDTGPGAFTDLGFQQTFESADDKNLIAQAYDPYASSKTSSSNANIKKLNQAHEQKQLSEGGLQAQVPKSNALAEQACVQRVNNASGMQNLDGGGTDKREMPYFGAQLSNRSNVSYPMESAGVGNSNLTECGDIVWRLGGGPVKPNDGCQPAISSSQMQTEVSIGTYGSDISCINQKFDSVISQQDTNSQQSVFERVFPVNDLIDSNGNESIGNNQNWLSSTAPTRKSFLKDANDRLKNIGDLSNEKDLVSGEGYISSNSNHSQHSNNENDTKESSTSYSYDPNPFVCGNQVSLKTVSTQPLHENQKSSLWMNGEPSFLTSHQAHFQDLSNSAFRGSKSDEQTYVWEQNVSDNKVDGTKGCTVRDNELYARDNIPVNAFNSFNGSTSPNSVNMNVLQASQNMLEILHKVDRFSGSTAASTFEMPSPADLSSASRPNQPADMQRLYSIPPSPAQGEPLPTFASCSQVINSSRTRQFHQQSRNIDQTWSTSTPSGQSLPHIKTAQRENSSSASCEKHKETLDSVEQLNSLSAAPFDSSYVELEQQQFTCGKNQELLQQQLRHVSGHEALDQPINFKFNNQTNTSDAIKNALIGRQQHGSKDGGGTVAGQFTQAFPTPVGRLPSSRLAPFAGAPPPFSSESYSVDTESARKTITTFPQFGNSGAVLERKPGPQPMFHGMPQHAAFTKTFQNVWASMSPQQRLASLQHHKLSPHVLQSIVSKGLQKQDDHGCKKEKDSSEIVASLSDLHNREEHTSKGNSLNSMHLEKIDSGPKTDAVYSVPPLVHSYQEKMGKGKRGKDSAFPSSSIHSLNSGLLSKTKVDCSGRTVLPGVQQQNYSLLHQMQLIKGVNSNPQKVLGQNHKVTDPSSDVSGIDSKTGQRYIYGQSTGIEILPDSKARGNSQSSSTADMKMLSFVSKVNEEKNASMPSSEGQNGLQDQMNGLIMNSAASLIEGTDWTKFSPRMAPSCFAKYGTNKNDTMFVAKSDPQLPSKLASHRYFFPKVPGGMGHSTVVNQMSDDSQIGNNGQGSHPEIMTIPESSLRSLLPVIVDHGTVQGSKKRRNATVELLPWHKMVTEDQQTLQSISMTELDWAQAANRLTEKVGDDAEHLEGALSIPASKRRLILTTQLMQQLLPAAPARLLNAKAVSAYETVTFYVARAALADACSIVSYFARDSLVDAEHDYRIFEKPKISEKERSSMFSKIVEEFIGRSRKLEHDFLRVWLLGCISTRGWAMCSLLEDSCKFLSVGCKFQNENLWFSKIAKEPVLEIHQFSKLF